MPNFDSFERFFKEAIAQDSDDVSEISQRIYLLPSDQKVAIIKNRTIKEIELFLVRGRFSLRQYFSHNSKFSTSTNNQVGKDLMEDLTKTEIELKSGSHKTDANLGLSLISWALGETSAERLTAIMTDSMRIRRKLFIERDFTEIEKSKVSTMDRLVDYFESKLKKSEKVPIKLEHLFRCVSNGLTKGNEIKTSYLGTKTKPPLLLQADWENGLISYENSFSSSESILVREISRTQERMQVVCRGTESGITAKLYPHYKNSLSYLGVKIPAEHWVQTACFHVWIDK